MEDNNCNFKILDITGINGKRKTIDHDYRKTKFNSLEEMFKYKDNLEKKLGLKLYLMYKDYTDKLDLEESNSEESNLQEVNIEHNS